MSSGGLFRSEAIWSPRIPFCEFTDQSAWGLTGVLTYWTLKRHEEDLVSDTSESQGFFATTLPFSHT